MTLHATRDGDTITVHCTYATIRFEITEHAAHIGHFWGELGKLLKDAEKPVLSLLTDVELPEPGILAGTASPDVTEVQQQYADPGREDSGAPAE